MGNKGKKQRCWLIKREAKTQTLNLCREEREKEKLYKSVSHAKLKKRKGDTIRKSQVDSHMNQVERKERDKKRITPQAAVTRSQMNLLTTACYSSQEWPGEQGKKEEPVICTTRLSTKWTHTHTHTHLIKATFFVNNNNMCLSIECYSCYFFFYYYSMAAVIIILGYLKKSCFISLMIPSLPPIAPSPPFPKCLR